MLSKLRKAGLVILALIGIIFISCFLAEAALRILAPLFSPSLRVFIEIEADGFRKSTQRVSRGCQIILEDKDFNRRFDIIAVGDSMVFGSLIGKEDTFTSILNKESGLEVLNLWLPGYGPCDYNRMLDYMLGRLNNPPSLVLYFIFADDIGSGKCEVVGCRYATVDNLFIKESEYQANLGFKIRLIREKIFGRSILYQLFKRMLTFRQLQAGRYFHPIYSKNGNLEFLFAPVSYWEPYLDLKQKKVRVELGYMLDKIKSASVMTEKAGSHLIVILMPFKEQIYLPLFINEKLLPASVYVDFYNLTYDKLFSDIKKMGIQTIDLRPSFVRAAKENLKLFWSLDGHLTPDGHKVVARTLLDKLRGQTKNIAVIQSDVKK
ncbi:hypothetical protein D4R78_05040 [bacterium]|nr:MAG: hypothetical protein D4R78_05040 [bacterium]